jgi:hypothetical protein
MKFAIATLLATSNALKMSNKVSAPEPVCTDNFDRLKAQ